jgi:hypothetical protein
MSWRKAGFIFFLDDSGHDRVAPTFLGRFVGVFRSRESVRLSLALCPMFQRLMHGKKFLVTCRLGMAGRVGG